MVVIVADGILVAHEMFTDVCVLTVVFLSSVLVDSIIGVCHKSIFAINCLIDTVARLLAFFPSNIVSCIACHRLH